MPCRFCCCCFLALIAPAHSHTSLFATLPPLRHTAHYVRWRDTLHEEYCCRDAAPAGAMPEAMFISPPMFDA